MRASGYMYPLRGECFLLLLGAGSDSQASLLHDQHLWWARPGASVCWDTHHWHLQRRYGNWRSAVPSLVPTQVMPGSVAIVGLCDLCSITDDARFHDDCQWLSITEVSHQGNLSGWSFIRWSLIKVVSLVQSLIRIVYHLSGLSGWSFIRWSLIRVVSHPGGLIRVV